MAFGVVYKITNLVNGKVYIGQTTLGLEFRFNSHCRPTKNKDNSLIFKAIKKYGREKFKIEQIDFADCEKELNKKEIYHIKNFNSMDLNIGYNLHPGGNVPPRATYASSKKGAETRKKKCIQINLSTGEETVFESPTDAGRILGVSGQIINKCCRYPNKHTYKNYKWVYYDFKFVKSFEEPVVNSARHNVPHSFETKLIISQKRKGVPSYFKPIIAKKDKDILKFKSINEASEILGIERRCISNVLHNYCKTSHGYSFEFIER